MFIACIVDHISSVGGFLKVDYNELLIFINCTLPKEVNVLVKHS
jgi:hypothetical protein